MLEADKIKDPIPASEARCRGAQPSAQSTPSMNPLHKAHVQKMRCSLLGNQVACSKSMHVGRYSPSRACLRDSIEASTVTCGLCRCNVCKRATKAACLLPPSMQRTALGDCTRFPSTDIVSPSQRRRPRACHSCHACDLCRPGTCLHVCVDVCVCV